MFETRILHDLIIYKKNRNITWKSDAKRLEALLEELAPHAEGMPFEKAWKNYIDKNMEIVKQ